MKSPDHHIHHGTSTNPNPHEEDMTPEQIAERRERIIEIVDKLKYDGCNPSDLLQEDCYDLVDQIIHILYASDDDDWLGNIHDLIDKSLETHAEWLIDQGNTTVSLAIKKKLGVE